MLVGVACRQNRVRSRFVEAVLSHHIKNVEFYSFGSAVQSGTPASEIVCELIAELGLHDEWQACKQSTSKSLTDVTPFLKETTYLICMDQTVFEMLSESLDVQMKEKLMIASSSDSFLSAVDPVNLDTDRTRLEVYKAALKSIQTLRSIGNLPKNNVYGYLPKTESDLFELVSELKKNMNRLEWNIVISLDFYTPMANLFQDSALEIIHIKRISDIFLSLKNKSSKNSVDSFLEAEYEISWSYLELFSELSSLSRLNLDKARIHLILPNLNSSFQVSAIAILGAWFADHLKIIGFTNPNFANGGIH